MNYLRNQPPLNAFERASIRLLIWLAAWLIATVFGLGIIFLGGTVLYFSFKLVVWALYQDHQEVSGAGWFQELYDLEKAKEAPKEAPPKRIKPKREPTRSMPCIICGVPCGPNGRFCKLHDL